MPILSANLLAFKNLKASKGVSPLRYVCNNRFYDGLYASDHFPVYVDFAI